MTAMMLTIRERVSGFDPDEFWQRSPDADAWPRMVAKYLALAELARVADDEARKPLLRSAATRWPGSLREAELIGPDRVDERALAAAAGLAEPARARAWWTVEPAAIAVLLWAELHRLLDDQRRFRAAAANERAGDSEAFAGWIVRDAGQDRWPAAARIPELVGAKLRVRAAYLWLAARAGLALPDLNGLLLARAGHWDRRAGDPDWAHAV